MKPTNNSVQDSSLDPELLSAVDDIHQRFNDGERVSIDDYVKRFPQHEATLRQVFQTFQFMTAYGDSVEGASPIQSKPQELRKQIGEFTIIRQVGRGGMGVVYEAYQGILDRRVALKILPLAGLADRRQIQRFKNEARAAATLHHTNIVPIHSVGSDQGIHYYAMQFIDGPSFAEVIRELNGGVNSLPPDGPTGSLVPSPIDGNDTAEYRAQQESARENDTHRVIHAGISTSRQTSPRDYFRTVAEWIERAADGLAHAHENGVLHRDIKPGNLMVDETGHVWITDFGLARLEADASLTTTGDMLGTLRYMSPEQIRGDRVLIDQHTDIYSLGLTLFELLTLRPAFQENDRAALLKQISQLDPPGLRQIDERIPVDLETIVLKAIEKSPQDRYDSAAEMAADLLRFLEQRPILAKPPRIRDRALKWLRRHPGIAATVAAASFILLLVSSGFALALNQQQRETARQRDTVRTERDEADRQRKIAEEERDFVKQERDRANSALQLAIATMDEFFSEIGENWIAEDRALSNYQSKILYRASEILPMIADNYPKNEQYVRHAGVAHRRAASVLMRVREFRHAQDNLKTSRELLSTALAQGDEEQLKIRQELAEIEYQQGQVALALGQYSLAEEKFAVASQCYAQISQDFPDDELASQFCRIRAIFSEYEGLRLKSLLLQEDSLLVRLDELLDELDAIFRQETGMENRFEPTRRLGIAGGQNIGLLIIKLRVLKSASLRRLGRYQEAQKACNSTIASLHLASNLDQRDGRRALVEARLDSALTHIELQEFEAAQKQLETALSELEETFLFDGTPKDFGFAVMLDGQGSHLSEPQAFTLYACIQSRLALLKSRLGEVDAVGELLYEARATCAAELTADPTVAQFAYDLMFCAEIVPQIKPLADPQLLLMLEACEECVEFVCGSLELDPFHKSQYSMILAAKGQYWRAQQRPDKALELFHRAHEMQLEVAEQVSDHPMIARRLEQLSHWIQAEKKSADVERASRVASYELKGSFLSADEERYAAWSLTLGPSYDNDRNTDPLFVVDGQNKRVLRYPTIGGMAGEPVVQRGQWGIMGTLSITIGPDANLYVVDGAARAIMRFDSSSGLPLGVDTAPENAPATFVAAGTGGLQQPNCIAFDSNGDLYVSSSGSVDGESCNQILQFHGPNSPLAGQPKQVFIDKTAGLRYPRFMVFGEDGFFYVTDNVSHSLLRFAAENGTAMPANGRRNAELVPAGLGGLKNPKGFRLADVDGDNQPELLVTSETNEILCFESTNGGFKGVLMMLSGNPWEIEILNQTQIVVAIDKSPAQPGDVLLFER